MDKISLAPPGHVHLIGVCGTAMGNLALLLAASGYTVSGSDAHTYPPMSEELARRGVHVSEGFGPENLVPRPDLVVVGNVCRQDHPEVVAATALGLAQASLPRVLHDLFLSGRQPLVVAGTHGKTTTSALLAHLLTATGRDPSALVGGVAADLGGGFRLGAGPHFVIEGDEYDSAWFEKSAKFLQYAPRAAIVTSVEHDHVDIYPDFASYRAAFVKLAQLVPGDGLLVLQAGDPEAAALARFTTARVVTYGLVGAAASLPVSWRAELVGPGTFELTIDGASTGRWRTPLAGRHNLANAVAALAVAHLEAAVPLDELRPALADFRGVRRRQEVVGRPRGIAVYDDFAHHPTAVRETIAALATLHEPGRLAVAFEPRSATACRRAHQDAYAAAFAGVGLAVIAPVGRARPDDDRLDTARLAAELRARGLTAIAAADHDEVLDRLVGFARPGDGIALLSNGAFGGLPRRLVEALG